jgi:hypothetical protein
MRTKSSSAIIENTNLWLNQAKSNFNWNTTSVLQWNAVNRFVGVAVSPFGDLYGIQHYSDVVSNTTLAYSYNFTSQQWSLFQSGQVQGIRFDKGGNLYFLDTSGNVYLNSSNTVTNLISGVQDFEVTHDGKIYAVATGAAQSANANNYGVFDNTSNASLSYKLFSNNTYSAVALQNEVPVFQLPNGSLSGYGSQCVNDFSIGVDGALWAISCTVDNNSNTNSTNYLIVKWNPFLSQWYYVQGKSGVKISVFNEISAAVLTGDGLIYVSSNTRDGFNNTVYTPNRNRFI